MHERPPLDPELLLAHAAFIRQTARALLRGDSRVDDVVQDTYVAALEGGPRRASSIRAWLAGVVRNLALTVRRRDSARARRERIAGNRRTPLPSAAEIAGLEEARRRMIAAVLALREPYRSALLLRYYEDLPPREIALRLGVPVETARTRVRRGLALLREELDRTGRNGPGTWTVALLPLCRIPGGVARTVAASSAATKVMGGLAMGAKAKVGIAIVLVTLFCVGLAEWQSRSTEPDLPIGPESAGGTVDLASHSADADSPRPGGLAGSSPGASGEPSAADRGRAATDASNTDAGDGRSSPGFKARTWRPGPAGTVGGSVEIRGSGEPVTGVEVIVEREGARTSPEGVPTAAARTTTDEKGSFHFDSLEPGQYRIRFVHPGYAHRSLTGVRIGEKTGVQGLVMVLSSDPDTFGVIEGTVTGPDRTPLSGQPLVVHSEKPKVWVETVTDENGHYRVDRLLAGYYYVSLVGSADEAGVTGSGNPWTRFVLVTVRPRETTLADFAGYGTLSGVVVDDRGEALPKMAVELVPVARDEGYKVRKGETDEEGRFAIENAGLGPHEVVIRSLGEGWAVRTETLTLTGNDQEARIRLSAGVISGTILLAEEKVPPVKKRLYPGALLLPPDPRKEGTWGSHVALTYPDRSGKIRFRGIRPGRYLLRVVLKGYVTWERVVEVKWEEETTGIQIALRKLKVGTLRITVKDPAGKPVDGLNMTYGNPAIGYRSLRLDRPEPGLYVDRKVEAGEWTLFATREDLRVAQQKVRVVEGEVTEVTLTMEPK